MIPKSGNRFSEKDHSRTRSDRLSCMSALEALRHLAAALGKLFHDLLVEPDIHFGRHIERAFVAELLCQFLAGAEAAVEVKQLHQVDDRLLPIVLSATLR